MNPIKKVLRIKEIENLISYLECAIRFNVSSTIIVILQFQKNKLKNSKTSIYKKRWILSKKCIEQKRRKIKFPFGCHYQIQNIQNGEFDEESAWKKQM